MWRGSKGGGGGNTMCLLCIITCKSWPHRKGPCKRLWFMLVPSIMSASQTPPSKLECCKQTLRWAHVSGNWQAKWTGWKRETEEGFLFLCCTWTTKILKYSTICSNHWNVRQKQAANPHLLHILLPQLIRFFHLLLCFLPVFWFYGIFFFFLISGTTPSSIIPVIEHACIKIMVDESLPWFFLRWMHQVEIVFFPDQLLLLSTLYNTPLLRCSWQNIAASAKSFEGEKVCSKNGVCMIMKPLSGDVMLKWGAPVTVLLSLPVESKISC